MTAMSAAGIMLLHRTKQADAVLFLLRRGGPRRPDMVRPPLALNGAAGQVATDPDTHDHPGEWAFPGGTIELGETAEECAERETREEIGATAYNGLRLWTRSVMAELTGPPNMDPPTADYTTFLARVNDQFVPTLSDEHMGFAWAPPSNPPQPLHPGCAIALDRLHMNELDVAQAMAAGRLTSPQEYDNFWLFALRITGTGASYRTKFDEHVWRDPSIYLNENFIARCSGLPVIVEHPKTDQLTTSEYKARVIGAIMFAYLKGDEVWGIARIQDQGAAKVMREEQLSTSPAVAFQPSVNLGGQLKDGSTFLIEGEPLTLDHLAICTIGVWDKGEEPTGVDRSGAEEARQDSVQAEQRMLLAIAAGAARLRQRVSNRA